MMGHGVRKITLGESHQAGYEVRRFGSMARWTGISCVLLAAILSFGGILGGSPHHFFRSWLFAFVYIMTVCMGSIFFIMIQHATKAGWSTSIRRVAEHVAFNLQWIWILFLPLLALVISGHGGLVWHWMDPSHVDPIIEGKSGYLNIPFWVFRAVVFLTAFYVASRFFVGTSIAQDESGDPSLTMKMQKWVPAFIAVFGLSLTFSAFDWVMSIEAHWFSTMFGVYMLAMSFCGFFSTFCVIFFILRWQKKLLNEVTIEHWQDMGKLLFGLGIVFHAYIGFSQYMLIWYANIPEETTYYLARVAGPWAPWMWFLVFGHFFIPFLLLLTKHTKRCVPVMTGIAVWMLFAHAIDAYVLVMPMVPGEALAQADDWKDFAALARSGDLNDKLGYHPQIADILLLIGFIGFLVSGICYSMSRAPLVAYRDPRISEGLVFENM